MSFLLRSTGTTSPALAPVTVMLTDSVTLDAITTPPATRSKSVGFTATRTVTHTRFSDHRAASSCDCRHKTAPAVIAGSVIGSSLASIIVLALIFVLWRRKYRNRASNNTSGDNVPGMASVPNPIPILISSTHSGPIESTTSESSALTRRLSQSSRTAYEEEIEQLRQQIRYMEEEMELTYSGSAPPSYRSSRRSVASDPSGPSSSPPPPLPSRETAH